MLVFPPLPNPEKSISTNLDSFYVHMYMYLCTYVYVFYVHMYMYLCTYVYVFMYTCICIYEIE